MSETRVRPDLGNPFSPDLADIMPPRQQVENMPMVMGARSDQAMAEIVTAQHVAEKRDLGRVLAEFKQICVASGSKFFYRWEVNDKSSRTGKSVIEGPSIEMAMAAIGVYGNCRCSAMPVQESNTHVIFAARFIDYEKGVTIERTFQQRKNQNLGMRDADRAADLVYQIGQSKAMRNVVVAALKTLVEQGMVWAKSGVLERIAKSPDAARGYLAKKLQDMDIPLPRAEYVVGKVIAQWVAPDMARLYATLQTIEDGFSTKEEEFPPPAAREAGGDPPAADPGPTNQGNNEPPPPTGEQDGAVTKPRQPRQPRADKAAAKNDETPVAKATDQPSEANAAGQAGEAARRAPAADPADPTNSAADPSGTAEAAEGQEPASSRPAIRDPGAASAATTQDEALQNYAKEQGVDIPADHAPPVPSDPEPPADGDKRWGELTFE